MCPWQVVNGSKMCELRCAIDIHSNYLGLSINTCRKKVALLMLDSRPMRFSQKNPAGKFLRCKIRLYHGQMSGKRLADLDQI